MKEEQYLELWEFYQESGRRAASAISWNVTWILLFATGLLVYTLVLEIRQGPQGSAQALVLSLSFLGLLISLLALALLIHLARLIRYHRLRAEYCRGKVGGLERVVQPVVSKVEPWIEVCQIMGGFVLLLIAAYLLVFTLALF